MRRGWLERGKLAAPFAASLVFGEVTPIVGSAWRGMRRLFGKEVPTRSEDTSSVPIEAQPPLEVVAPACRTAGDPPERTGRNWRLP